MWIECTQLLFFFGDPASGLHVRAFGSSPEDKSSAFEASQKPNQQKHEFIPAQGKIPRVIGRTRIGNFWSCRQHKLLRFEAAVTSEERLERPQTSSHFGST